MEDFLAQAITSDPQIAAFFVREEDGSQRPPEEWFFGMSSLGLGHNVPVPERPYIVWNELSDVVHQTVRETSNARNRNFQHFVYDYKGDFTRINQILKEIRRVVKSIAPFTTSDGVRCSDALWTGVSGKIMDDGYDSCVRFGSSVFTVSD